MTLRRYDVSTQFWAVLGGIISLASVVLAYVTAIKSAKKESRKAVHAEAEERILVSSQLESISDSLESMNSRISGIAQDLSDLRITVAVHDDRFKRPLKAVGGD